MRLFMLVLSTLFAAADADLSGKWTISGDIVGNAVTLNCIFQQNAEAKLTGKCTVNDMEPTDIAGDVKDAEFKFSFTTAGYTLTYTGTLQSDAVKGSIAVAGVTGTFSGTRVKQ
jgi:hypothetical protein